MDIPFNGQNRYDGEGNAVDDAQALVRAKAALKSPKLIQSQAATVQEKEVPLADMALRLASLVILVLAGRGKNKGLKNKR